MATKKKQGNTGSKRKATGARTGTKRGKVSSAKGALARKRGVTKAKGRTAARKTG